MQGRVIKMVAKKITGLISAFVLIFILAFFGLFERMRELYIPYYGVAVGGVLVVIITLIIFYGWAN